MFYVSVLYIKVLYNYFIDFIKLWDIDWLFILTWKILKKCNYQQMYFKTLI